MCVRVRVCIYSSRHLNTRCIYWGAHKGDARLRRALFIDSSGVSKLYRETGFPGCKWPPYITSRVHTRRQRTGYLPVGEASSLRRSDRDEDTGLLLSPMRCIYIGLSLLLLPLLLTLGILRCCEISARRKEKLGLGAGVGDALNVSGEAGRIFLAAIKSIDAATIKFRNGK